VRPADERPRTRLALVREGSERSRVLLERHSAAIEQRLVAAFVASPDRLAPEQRPDPRHFADARLRTIFARACSLYDAGEPDLTVPRLALALDQHEELDRVGGPEFLSEILDSSPTAAYLDRHASEVRSLALDRELRRKAERIATHAGTRDELGALLRRMRELIEIWVEVPA
jgi:replicative DNA helicase